MAAKKITTKQKSIVETTTEYKNWIKELKQKFQSSQIKASVSVNSVLLEFYWDEHF